MLCSVFWDTRFVMTVQLSIVNTVQYNIGGGSSGRRLLIYGFAYLFSDRYMQRVGTDMPKWWFRSNRRYNLYGYTEKLRSPFKSIFVKLLEVDRMTSNIGDKL